MENKQHATLQPMGHHRKQKENFKTLQTNENGNTIAQYIWQAAKAVPRGKFTVRQSYLHKQEKSEISNFKYTVKGTRRRTSKAKSQQKKENNIRVELNEIVLKSHRRAQ